MVIQALDPSEDSEGKAPFWVPVAARSNTGAGRLFCANAEHGVCNWLVPAGSDDQFCVACSFNHVIPDLSVDGNQELWRRIEQAKHRLVYTLLLLKLPLRRKEEGAEDGLVFNFPDDAASDEKVMTGHDEGTVTIALREADDAEREKMRVEMGEYYRTLLGHFRHEIGHYYWNVLVRDAGNVDACRAVFGDDSRDYGESLQQHYADGPPVGWQSDFVSAYATTHPWEDFAETWAHYLHIVDTLQTAGSLGLSLTPDFPADGSLNQNFTFDPFGDVSIEEMLKAWTPLTVAVNSLNRSMGQPDFYPFVLTPAIDAKLSFIHRLVHGLILIPDEAPPAVLHG